MSPLTLTLVAAVEAYERAREICDLASLAADKVDVVEEKVGRCGC